METSPLPAINPPYDRTAVGAHVIGILHHPIDQLGPVTDALTNDSVRLADINVFGRRGALGEFDPEMDATFHPRASRIVHRFDLQDHELRHLEQALATDEAIISVRVDTYERHRVLDIMKLHGVRDLAFYSPRRHRRPVDDFGAGGNAALSKRTGR